MAVVNEPIYLGDIIAAELQNALSRQAVTVQSGAGVVALGTVMGRVTATGEFRPCNPANADGSQTAVGILAARVDATAAAAVGPLVRGAFRIKNRRYLVFSGTWNETQRNTAIAQLEAAGASSARSA